MMRNQVWLAGAVAMLAAAWSGGIQAQDTPRKGGTIRFTSPYAASFGSLDLHTTPRATDEIVGKAINRTLYNWDSANNKLALELATSVTASADGLVHTFKLRDDAYFHNGRKMTADDVIASFTRIMDGAKAYPGARFVRIIKGAIEVEKGQAKEISGLKKIDDFTLEMTLTDRVDPGYYFFDGITAILPKEEFEKPNFASNPVGLGPFKFKEHIPGSRVVVERWEKFYKPGKPYADRLVFVIMAEAAARDVAFRNKEIDTSILGPAQYVAYRADPQLSKGILEVADLFVVNKSDREGADRTVRELRAMLELRHATAPLAADPVAEGKRQKGEFSAPSFDWEVPIVKTMAVRSGATPPEGMEDGGLAELTKTIGEHHSYLRKGTGWLARETQRARAEFVAILRERLVQRALRRLERELGTLDEVSERIARRAADPYTLADELAQKLN